MLNSSIFWIVLYIIASVVVIYGIIIFSKKKMMKKVDYKDVLYFFKIVFILKILDCLSTAYFSYKIGIENEANLMVRIFMTYLGIPLGIFISLMISLPALFFWLIAVNYYFKNIVVKPNLWKIFKIIIIIIISTIIILNMSV